MGWFTPKRDWSSGSIEPKAPWINHARAYPDSVDVVRAAVSESGVDPGLIDVPAAVVAVWNVVAGVAKQNLSDPKAAADLEQVMCRPDVDDQKLWDFLTHQDAQGVAVRNHLVEEFFDTGQIRDMLVSMMRDGSLRIALGGRDRVEATPTEHRIEGADRIGEVFHHFEGGDRI